MVKNRIFKYITSKQIRAARSLLEWSQQRLAEEAYLSITPITRLERGIVDSRDSTLKLVVEALENAGIEFINEKKRIGVNLNIDDEEE